MVLTVMSLNIQTGGGDRWPGLVELIRDVGPDVLALQECRGWLDEDASRLADAERDLGMRGLVAPSRSGFHTALMVGGAARWSGWEVTYAGELLHGFGAARLAVEGLAQPLVTISTHLTPYSASAAAQEAQILIARAYRHGGYGMIIGDVNHCPLGDPEPPWGQIPAYNRSSRTLTGPDGRPRSNTIVGEVLHTGGLVDVAAHLAETRGEPALRRHTGAGLVRVDQVHVTPAVLPGVLDYRTVDPHGLSDHWGLVCTLDTARISASPQTWI
jgi:endonuclease/exonuclease/phosphatase family metal-dependent hydrolase